MVSNDWTRKSLGEQETFEQDTRSPSVVTGAALQHGGADHRQTAGKRILGFRTVTVTVRFSDFQTSNRSHSIKNGIRVDNDGEALRLLKQEALTLLSPFLDARENPRERRSASSACVWRSFLTG